LHNRRQEPFVSDLDRAGFADGPLKWRANGGAEWTSGSTMVGANLQFFSRYRIVSSEYQDFPEFYDLPQGSKWVRSQMYLDLYASRRFRIHGPAGEHEVALDFGIVNVLDQAPPFQFSGLNSGPQISLYGDPRGRRFELGLSASF
jgi:outer membrane receptor protein involved in Fe transport